MPLLQESQPGRDLLNKIKVEAEDTLAMSAKSVANFPGLHTSSLLTPGQILAASQTAAFMAASGLPVSLHATLSSNPGLFHHSIFSHVWPNSPQSPPSIPSPISPNSKARKNNNNNIVSSSSGDQLSGKPTPVRRKNSRKIQQTHTDLVSPLLPDITPSGQLSPPTSGSSPPSSTGEPGTAKEPNRDKQFTCGVCNRSFGYKHVLQNHERTHTGEKPFECPECHKRFTRDHHLKTHMRLHTGERPYHCDHCDRHFVQVANLRRHLRVHTGERPYSCEECSARFSDSNQLKAHVLIHKGEKPFQCERCQGRFRRRHHLMHHKCGLSGTGSIISVLDSSVADMTSGIAESPSSDHILHASHSSMTSSMTHNEEMLVDDYNPVEDPDVPEDLSSQAEKIRERKSREIRRVVRMPPAPLITLPLRVTLPEQTEPEDLSMSTTRHHRPHHSLSHSSGDSPLSHSPSSDNRDDVDDVDVEDEDLDEAATLFLKHHPQRIRK